jgi:hypothetical protein
MIRSCLLSKISLSIQQNLIKVARYIYSTKIESWKQVFISHLVCFGAPSEKIFTNTMMQGKKQSNNKKKRKSGAFSLPPGQTLWPASHVLWPHSPGQIPKWPLCL